MQIDFSVEELLEILQSIDCYDGGHSGRSEERDSILEKINHCLTEGTNLDMHLDKRNGHYIFRVPSVRFEPTQFSLYDDYWLLRDYALTRLEFHLVDQDGINLMRHLQNEVNGLMETYKLTDFQFVAELDPNEGSMLFGFVYHDNPESFLSITELRRACVPKEFHLNVKRICGGAA